MSCQKEPKIGSRRNRKLTNRKTNTKRCCKCSELFTEIGFGRVKFHSTTPGLLVCKECVYAIEYRKNSESYKREYIQNSFMTSGELDMVKLDMVKLTNLCKNLDNASSYTSREVNNRSEKVSTLKYYFTQALDENPTWRTSKCDSIIQWLSLDRGFCNYPYKCSGGCPEGLSCKPLSDYI
jgi:hypothetical protein